MRYLINIKDWDSPVREILSVEIIATSWSRSSFTIRPEDLRRARAYEKGESE